MNTRITHSCVFEMHLPASIYPLWNNLSQLSMLLCLMCTKAESNHFNIVTPRLCVGECLNFGACEMLSGKKRLLVVVCSVLWYWTMAMKEQPWQMGWMAGLVSHGWEGRAKLGCNQGAETCGKVSEQELNCSFNGTVTGLELTSFLALVLLWKWIPIKLSILWETVCNSVFILLLLLLFGMDTSELACSAGLVSYNALKMEISSIKSR